MTIYNGSNKLKSVYVGSENTNCITSVPNNIKYTISNGRLVVKAGSYIYAPNGSGIFSKIAITTDITSDTGGYSGLYAIAVDALTLQPSWLSILTNTVSGSTALSSPPSLQGWYDTTNNVIKRYNNGWQSPIFSLPVAKVTSDGTNITSVEQVFSWWSYIGSHQFFLPGIKGLKSNGFKPNGTYNNILVETDRVIVQGYGYQAVNQQVEIRANGTNWIRTARYYNQATAPAVSTHALWHNTSDNFNYYIGSDTSTGWVKNTDIDFVGITNANTEAETFKITSMTPATVQPSTTSIKTLFVYNGSDLVYQLNPYPVDTVIANTQAAGSITIYPGTYELKISGAGGTGGHSVANWGNHNGSGGSGACWEGTIKIDNEYTMTWTTGTGAAASVAVSFNGTSMVTAGGGGNAVVNYSTSQGGAAGVVTVQSAFNPYIVSTSKSSDGTKGASTAVSWGDYHTAVTAAPSTMGWGVGESSVDGGRTDGGFYLKRIA